MKNLKSFPLDESIKIESKDDEFNKVKAEPIDLLDREKLEEAGAGREAYLGLCEIGDDHVARFECSHEDYWKATTEVKITSDWKFHSFRTFEVDGELVDANYDCIDINRVDIADILEDFAQANMSAEQDYKAYPQED